MRIADDDLNSYGYGELLDNIAKGLMTGK